MSLNHDTHVAGVSSGFLVRSDNTGGSAGLKTPRKSCRLSELKTYMKKTPVKINVTNTFHEASRSYGSSVRRRAKEIGNEKKKMHS